jgi:hypothetical protein
MLRRERHYGDSLKEGCCSKKVIGPFGVGVWKFIRRGVGNVFKNLLDMWWVMSQRSVFGMMYGVGLSIEYILFGLVQYCT